MYKIGILLSCVVLISISLRPNFYQSLLGIEKDKDEEIITTTTRSLSDTLVIDETPIYADGYSAEDFVNMDDSEAFEQPTLLGGVWDVLTTLKFDIKYDEEVGEAIFKPLFKQEHLALENTSIIIEGFIVPIDNVMSVMDVKGDIFMLSALPAASCFFCSAAGPETVIEVQPHKPIPYTQEIVKLKGTLTFNREDYLRLPYILKNVEAVW